MSNCIGPTNIIPDNNQVILQDVNKTITITDNNCCTTVDVTQPVTSVIQVSAGLVGPIGPSGSQGPIGPSGSAGPSGSSAPFTYVSGTTWNTTSSIEITGSFIVSGSSTFKNIGLALFSGSTNLSGSGTLNGYSLLTSNNTGSLLLSSSFNSFTSSYYTDSASFNTSILNNSSSIALLSSSYLASSASFSSSIASLTNNTSSYVLNSQTSSMSVLSASFAVSSSRAVSASYSSTASYIQNAQTASYVLNAVSASFASTASYVTGSIYTSTNPALSASYATTASYVQNAQTASYVITAQTASYVLQAVSASYASTASYVLNAISSSFATSASYTLTSSYSNNINGSNNHIAVFSGSNALKTGSLYQSGSTTIVINQDNATSANPEALYVWQPSTSSFNVISGKGNLDNYLQLNIQNTNQGTVASSDVVATANNGNETDNYIDMGINSENFAGFLGGPNDSYVYTHGHNFWIGNINDGYKTYFFNSSSLLPIITLNSDNAEITGSLFGTASWAQNAITASNVITASYASNADLLDGKDSTIFATTGSNTFKGNQTVTGSLFTTGSNTLIGTTTLTGSLNITGSTLQVGNNTLAGTTTLSGSIIMSGSVTSPITPTIKIYGDTETDGVIKFMPVSRNINTSISASYIYVSGSTNDLYFSQNGEGYANVTRLRWLEGNLYTGLLNGGIITTQTSTTYQISSGSGIVVNLNASLNANPYPTVTYVNWSNLSASIAPLSSSYDQQFVSIQSNGTIFAQGTPFTDGQFNTLIPIGIVIHQNRSTINAVQTFPSVAYGWKQRSSDFIKAFGPLKISGYTLSPSGSSTGSLVLSGGVAWVDGRNYTVDPNNPSYIDELTGIVTSKIYRYRQSGSDWAYDTNAGVGYPTIDPANYSNNGTLTPVGSNDWTIQRVFYFPNSATKAFYIYYGNATYANQAAALAAVNTEPFSEAPNTAANAIYVGFMLLRNNANFTTPASYTIYATGLFRGSGTSVTSGGGGGSTLAGLADVSITSPTNGQPLVYNSSTLKWQNSSALTASISGNATTATSASYASTASYVPILAGPNITVNYQANGIAITGSAGGGGTPGGSANQIQYNTGAAFGGVPTLLYDGINLIGTGSFSGSFVGTLTGTSSYAATASYVISSSYAATASFLLGSVTSASYAATASTSTNFTVSNTLEIDGTLTDRSTVLSTIVGSNNLYTQATGSYTSAFGKYTLYNGANARAGEFITVWNGTTTTYTDVSTTDIGNTSDITFTSAIVTGNIQINAVAGSSGWTIKMLTTFI